MPDIPESHGRAPVHGEAEQVYFIGANGQPITHCHDCWKYTDNMRRDGDLVHEAIGLLVNGGDMYIRDTDAYKAADAFMAAKFRAEHKKVLADWPPTKGW